MSATLCPLQLLPISWPLTCQSTFPKCPRGANHANLTQCMVDHMYTHVCIYIYTHVYIYIYMYAYILICRDMCIFYLYVHTYANLSISLATATYSISSRPGSLGACHFCFAGYWSNSLLTGPTTLLAGATGPTTLPRRGGWANYFASLG